MLLLLPFKTKVSDSILFLLTSQRWLKMGIFFSLGENLEIPLHANDCDLRNFPRKDDNVIFDISQVRATRETKAVNIRVVETTKAAR